MKIIYIDIIYGFTEINPKLPNNSIDTNLSFPVKDIPYTEIELLFGEPITLMRNLNTRDGIVKKSAELYHVLIIV